MIIAYHIVYHCVMWELTDAGSIERLNNGLFNHPVFYRKLYLLNAINSWGIIGNAVFMLLSGYFMRRNAYRTDIRKVSAKLLTQLGFAAVVLVIASAAAFKLSRGQAYLSLMNITIFNGMSWYVGYYFIVILSGVLFFNKLLAGLDKSGYLAFVTASFALISFEWSAGILNGIGSNLHIVATGIFLYALGGYIYEYEPFKNVRLAVLFVVIILMFALIYVSGYNTTRTSIENFMRSTPDGVFYQTVTGYGNNSGLIIITAVCMFEIFRRIRIPDVRLINFLGKSTLMIYLMHDNEFFYSIWRLKDWISVLYYTPMKFLLELAVWTFGTFAIGVMAFTAFNLMMRLITRSKRIFLKNVS